MVDYTESLPDGGVLLFTRGEWQIRYFAYTRLRLDGAPYRRDSPEIWMYVEEDYRTEAELAEDNWQRAERVRSEVRDLPGTVRRDLAGGMCMVVAGGELTMTTRTGRTVRSPEQAAEVAASARATLAMAESRRAAVYGGAVS